MRARGVRRNGARLAEWWVMRRTLLQQAARIAASLKRPVFALATIPFIVGGCATSPPKIVPLGVPVTDNPNMPLEVVTRSTAVRDPLPVANSDVVYGDIEAALGHAVSSATVRWAELHKAQRPEGWQLTVEIVDADAQEQDGGRLIVRMNARATLRTRVGNGYLAQTQTSCSQTGIVTPERGAPVLYNCMTRIGRDLSNWLAGVEP
jgi:hypothetical protein